MKNSKKLLPVLIGIALTFVTPSRLIAGGLIPAVESGLYYRLNGGQDIPWPAFFDTNYIPLDADSEVGLGFDCGAFNPMASITKFT